MICNGDHHLIQSCDKRIITTQDALKKIEKIIHEMVKARKERKKTGFDKTTLNGWVCFSADLLKEPRDFQDYVIVHDLLHLQVPNHGKLFKSLLNAYLPKWEKALKERINNSGRKL